MKPRRKASKAKPVNEPRNHCIPVGGRYLAWRFLPGDIVGAPTLFPVLVDFRKTK